eukprot:523743-Prorocentrum_minimum.AAC.1
MHSANRTNSKSARHSLKCVRLRAFAIPPERVPHPTAAKFSRKRRIFREFSYLRRALRGAGVGARAAHPGGAGRDVPMQIADEGHTRAGGDREARQPQPQPRAAQRVRRPPHPPPHPLHRTVPRAALGFVQGT